MNRQQSLALTLFVLLSAAGLASAGSHQVSISSSAFNPATLNVNVGDTVRWTNIDSAVHTVTADGGQFDSGDIGPGYSYEYMFATVGTFSYSDRHNYYATGRVSVSSAGGGSS